MRVSVSSKIGDTNTLYPKKPYTCEQQLDVVKALFGNGRLILPSSEPLLVKRRSEGKGYSSTSKEIFVANDGIGRPLLAEGAWFKEPMFSGFLLTATGAALNAARKSLDNLDAGEEKTRRAMPSEAFAERRNRLAYAIMEYHALGGPDDADDDEDAMEEEDDYTEEVTALSASFLGEKLARVDASEGRFTHFVESIEGVMREVFAEE